MSSAPYRVYIRVFAARSGACVSALEIARDRADGGEDVRSLSPRRMSTNSVFVATLLATKRALDALAGRGPIVLHTNNEAVAGVLLGTMTAKVGAAELGECWRLMGKDTTVTVIPNREGNAHMERAMQRAMEGARG